ncbi:manganese efflux pump [Clostridium sp. 'deep sea']|uniref:manganese efflux pump MntP n=1 Tax=Clostridium sp. 'deep sea' TaxID=2779445 RepID=UPI0018969FC4|nr:manganese efflux pump MntP family protein [Clostridium sp. 'deep sea']QOR34077.1 manganese efflux pump [Clostridium sp. 'deep sea']
MGIYSTMMLAVGLSMDAMAVSITCGISNPAERLKNAIRASIAFGLFQALMTAIGWFVGSTFSAYIEAVDHYIALILLSFIGINMIKEGIKGDKEPLSLTSNWLLFTLAIATSIDALAAGISLSSLGISIIMPALLIGLFTFSLSFIGVFLGCKLSKISNLSGFVDILGGLILVSLGLKIFVEHVFL